MNSTERRSVVTLGLIYALRMLGLFMVLPVMALAAQSYAGYTPALAGLAIGIYGLTQACLQIPFGAASDRFGRKPVIAVGLALFCIGSVVAALAPSMGWLVFGRALQGAGAIAAAVMALAADLTRDEQRTKAMAGIGASIGLAFAVAMVLGPVVTAAYGLNGLFWCTAGLALAGACVLFWLVPDPPGSHSMPRALTIDGLAAITKDGQLRRLYIGISVLHMVLTATFVALPLALRDIVGLELGSHWQVYLGIMLASLILMVPAIVYGERRGAVKAVFVGAVVLLAVALAGLGFAASAWPVLLMGVLFFSAFNVLEALLPSLVSRTASPDHKGAAMGVYSTAQFFGAFVGGSVGGLMHAQLGTQGVFAAAAIAVSVWLIVAVGMVVPRRPARQATAKP
ncbi:MAG: MFS transporter [Chromatiales bacterium]|nr:MFS transporter [Chromatiales bacterium]